MVEKDKYLRSFGRKKSRKLRDGNKKLLEETLPRIKIDSVEGLKSSDEIWLEIGFGGGEHLIHQAVNNPQVTFIGCEPFINGTVKLLREVESGKLNNVRVSNDDFRLIAEKFPDKFISRAFILFPDPWPKARHHKRRLICDETLDILARILKDGAKLRVATDDQNYAKWIIEHFIKHKSFDWDASSKADWQTQPADHIETKYQKKALISGRNPLFFNFTKNY